MVIVTLVPLLLPAPEGKFTSQQLSDKDSYFININDVNIHYKIYGKGESYFILLHGTLMTSYTWNEIIAPLAEIGTVIAYDRPAFGLTSRPMPGEWGNTSPYGYEYQVEMLRNLMDVLNIKQAVLIGSSMGGAISAITAQKYPQRVKALVLDDPVMSRHAVPAWVRLLAATPQMRKLGPLFLNSQVSSFAKDLYQLSWHDPSRIKQEYLDEYFKILDMKDFDRGLWELIVAAKPFEELVKPEEIQVPTLVIAGDDDRIAGIKKIEDGTKDITELAKKITGARFVIIPECGHLPHEERPEQFIQAVIGFVSELPSAK